MKFEHFALNVKEPISIANWYCKHLGMQVVLQKTESPFMTFLADESGRVVVELYCNEKAPFTNFDNFHHLTFHMAFMSDDALGVSARLQGVGASFVEEINPEPETHLVMLKDPWNIPLQICQRKHSLLSLMEN